VDEDHIEAGELRRLLDALDGHLPDVSHELDLEVTDLAAPLAPARVERVDLSLTGMEGSVHGHDLLDEPPTSAGFVPWDHAYKKAASPSISSGVRPGAASMTASSSRATASCAWARLVRWAFMKGV
jgi:hypothetical protein